MGSADTTGRGAPAKQESYLVTAPGGGRFVPTIMVRREPDCQCADPQALAQRTEGEMVPYSIYSRLDAGQQDSVLPNGAGAREALYRWETRDGGTLYQRWLFTVWQGDGYILTLTIEDPSGEGRSPEGEAVMRSFSPPARLEWPEG